MLLASWQNQKKKVTTMSIKSFKTFVTEKTDYAKSVKQAKESAKNAAGEKSTVKQGCSKVDEAIADDYKAPKDSDKEATDLEPRGKGEKKFADDHKKKKEVKDHPVATDAQFKG